MNNNGWEPTFEGWAEDKVEMADSMASTHNGSRSDYGVLVQQPDQPYEGNGAIFFIDPQHIYLRYDWGLWYTVAIDDSENCQVICKRRTAKLYVCSMTAFKDYPVKVYHIESLPEELFGKSEEESADATASAESERENSFGVGVIDDPSYVKEAVRCRNGTCIAESEDSQFLSAFYEVNGHFLCVSFFRRAGDWLADEEALDGERWPIWFGECETAVSPFAAALALRDKIRPLVPKDILFHTIVVLSPGCSIVNEDEFALPWQGKHVAFVRQQELEGSCLTSVDKLLDCFQGKARPSLAKYGPAISDALDDFSLENPK